MRAALYHEEQSRGYLSMSIFLVIFVMNLIYLREKQGKRKGIAVSVSLERSHSPFRTFAPTEEQADDLFQKRETEDATQQGTNGAGRTCHAGREAQKIGGFDFD